MDNPAGPYDFFQELTQDECTLVLSHATEKFYQPGEIIFQKGDTGDYFLHVLEGVVRITLYSEDGKEIILKLIHTGEIFGEFSFLDGLERSANAVAQGACRLRIFRRQTLLPILEQHPQITLKLVRHLSSLLRQNTEQISALSFLPLPARLARLLLQLSDPYGTPHPEGVLLQNNLSQNDYARMIAASRESINKQLNIWQEKNIIHSDRDGLILRQPKELARIAGSID